MIIFCTYFDHRYLDKGVALLQSIARHADVRYAVRVLCLDAETEGALCQLALPHVEPHRLEELERVDPALLAVKPTRSRVEYYWTLTPVWIRACLDAAPAGETLVYLDADMFFFAPISHLTEALGPAAIGVVPHDYGPAYASLHAAGRFNVGVIPMKTGSAARVCIEWWRKRCLEWCYQRFEDGKFGDQAYLDEWPHRFEGVRVLDSFAIKLAPWNLDHAELSVGNRGQIHVNDKEVICFHFHALKRWRKNIFQMVPESVVLNSLVRGKIYRPYLEELARAERDLANLPDAGCRPVGVPWREVAGNLVRGHIYRNLSWVRP